MKYETIGSLVESLASEFLFLDERDIDVPSAGKFLNLLEGLAKEAEPLGIAEIKEVAAGLTSLLEKVILDTLPSREEGFVAFEKGVSVMQKIIDDYKNMSQFKGDMTDYRNTIANLIGAQRVPVAAAPAPEQEAVSLEEAKPAAAVAEEEPAASADEDEPIEKLANVQDEALLRDFITEGLEYIDEIEVNILNLEQSPEDKDYINTIFRPFHSIKGVASFLNLEKIRTLAHSLENLLDKARNGNIMVTPPLIDVILDGADALKTMIGQLRDQLENRPITPMKVNLIDLVDRVEKIDKGLEIGGKVKKLGDILVDEGAISRDELEKTLSEPGKPQEKKVGEVLIEEGKVTPKQVSQALRKQTEQVTDMSTIRVDIRKLDDMIDMVGELVITQSMVQQGLTNLMGSDRNLMRDIAQLFRITSGLQRVSTGLRMVPIKQTFQRMSRLVRDLAKNSGKLVAVELVGEETEIDRNMVDEIYNPLVHMIRNSVDHGLEPPEERIRVGKPEKGLIQLKAYHGGGSVVIEISDDGRGLNKDKIIAKAIKNSSIQSADGMSDQDIFKLIFLPGLSTAEKVTDVSGRGVGMDVVKQAIEKLRGKAEIESTFGKGTTFVTRFPLTMAIIDGMIVKVGTERYILPTTAIRQTLRPTKESITTVVGRGETINVMGQLLPLVRLYELFNIAPEQVNPWESIVVVVEGEDRSKCLLVDKILGKAEVVIKSLGESLKSIKGVSGGAILGDGNIGLILDTEGLFELSETA
jgi:two-component system, chemotaxis family, sensor kinase CheA